MRNHQPRNLQRVHYSLQQPAVPTLGEWIDAQLRIHPCKHVYLDHNPKVKGLSLAYKYSQKDFPQLREVFAGWGIIHILMDNELTPELMLASFRHTMETLAPDVVGVPLCFVDDAWHDDDVTALYWDLRKIADEYAANMRWAA